MDFDFELILVTLVAVCGFITLLDRVWLAKKRNALAQDQHSQQSRHSRAVEQTTDSDHGSDHKSDRNLDTSVLAPAWIEYPRSFFPVLLVVLLLRSFLIEPFQIPSGSMLPTLKVGDFILVNKFAYGLRLPVLRTQILNTGKDPVTGDIMVFKYPKNPKINYIKRVIGVPGDEIVYSSKKLTINGIELDYRHLAETSHLNLAEEQLGDVNHRIQFDSRRLLRSGQWRVPEGHYFVMGDNRDNSLDSRSWGFVPESHIVGEAFAIWMHKPGIVPSFSRNGMIH